MRRTVLLLLGLIVQIATGCTSRTPYTAFSIPRDEFLRTTNTIALAPVVGPAGIEVSESSLVEIDSLIEGHLLGAGYSCVSGQEYSAAWDRIVEQTGGLYDPETGEPDELRLEVAREQLRRDLVDMHFADYVLFPEIWVVEAGFSAGVAEWDGVSQAIVGVGTRILNVIDAVLNQNEGFLQPGVTNALSLGVVVEDLDGREIFQHVGGIEVLKELDDDNEEEDVSFEAVLNDQERNLKAVRTALLPLVEMRTSRANGN